MLANLSRRQSLKGLALFGLGASVAAPLGAKPALAQPAPSDIKDEDIFQFALNLEYMEAEYYLRATTGKGIDAADAGSNAGDVKGGHKVKFHSKDIQEFAEELAENELAHVRFYRKTLGGDAVSRPAIDFEATGDHLRALASIKAKTLIITAGQLDLYNPVQEAEEAARYIPDARLAPIPSVQGHVAASPTKAADVEFMNRVAGDFLDTVTDRGRKLQ